MPPRIIIDGDSEIAGCKVGISVSHGSNVEISLRGNTRITGAERAIEERDPALPTPVSQDQLIQVLRTFKAAAPQTVPQAVAVLQRDGLDKWLGAGADLVTWATFLFANQDWITQKLATVVGG